MRTDWQPIGTAPKDGTQILLAVGGRVVISRWYTHWLNGKPNPGRAPEWEQPSMYGGDYWGPLRPSHWMPLPDLPGAASTTQLADTKDVASDLLAALQELVEIVQHAIDQRSAKDLDSFTLQPALAAIARCTPQPADAEGAGPTT